MKQIDVTPLLKGFEKNKFQQDLIRWFQAEKRLLPWRVDQNPYKVWVSEIMLQQTQVDTVIPYFENFIKQFPTVDALAEAEEQSVLKAWEGLGYYSRARNLQSAVKEVTEKYQGKVPDDPEQLRTLKGVGPYTSGAILSIAYDRPEPAVDGNVMRVMARVLELEDDIAKPRTRKLFETILREVIALEDPSSFNQGLMELGALICKPRTPDCSICPIQSHCRAFRSGTQKDLPVKTKAKKQQHLAYFTMVFENSAGEIYIEQRPDKGLLANMWQFPMVSKNEVDYSYLVAWIEQTHGFTVGHIKQMTPIKHVFSHVVWDMDVYHCMIGDTLADKDGRFIDSKALSAYPFPVAHTKIIEQL